jgi:hypothetical protein
MWYVYTQNKFSQLTPSLLWMEKTDNAEHQGCVSWPEQFQYQSFLGVSQYTGVVEADNNGQPWSCTLFFVLKLTIVAITR